MSALHVRVILQVYFQQELLVVGHFRPLLSFCGVLGVVFGNDFEVRSKFDACYQEKIPGTPDCG